MEILVILLLVLLNGVFAMSELSLVSSRKFKLESLKKQGKTGAKAALELLENPNRFLSTVQIGITLIGVLLGVFSGENLTDDAVNLISSVPFLQPYANTLAVALVVILITYLSIVLGELLPKRIGMTFPEPIAMFLAKPMNILSKFTSPFVWLLTFSNDLLLQILGIKNKTDSKISEEELKALIKESAEGGEIMDIEQDIVERVFELGDRRVNTLFTHRSEIVYFNLNDSESSIRAKIRKEKHSAYPLCVDGNLDDIVGLVLVKDLFDILEDEAFDLRRVAKKPLFLNESMFAYQAMEHFKAKGLHYGIVIDEYGTTVGIITMDDVVDALVGDSTEQDQFEYQIVPRDENSWLVDGQYSMIDFLKYFGLEYPIKVQNFTTVAGLILHRSQSIPDVGDFVLFQNLKLEVVDKDGQRIDKVMVTRI
ncbi:hemolysin family protein [Algoriphagus confluentis]|uniref:Hemolysin family protein n=1 Tax=Algoriphagus confluentis TaxID=1697556 RepID=A0ABQ6PSN3_9BACT|nr:hemolysin family protein [Algoriphagus confluentis]